MPAIRALPVMISPWASTSHAQNSLTDVRSIDETQEIQYNDGRQDAQVDFHQELPFQTACHIDRIRLIVARFDLKGHLTSVFPVHGCGFESKFQREKREKRR